MDETSSHRHLPTLEKDDASLLKDIQEFLAARVIGNPYNADGNFAASIALLSPGGRAMAATNIFPLQALSLFLKIPFVAHLPLKPLFRMNTFNRS